MTTRIDKQQQRHAWFPGLAALLAFVSCKGIVIVTALFPLVSFTTPVNPHVQAAIISLLSLLTFLFIVINYRRCHHIMGPVVLSGIGVVMVVATMYLAYNPVIETAGLMVLMGSALWSWWASKHRVLTDVESMTTVQGTVKMTAITE